MVRTITFSIPADLGDFVRADTGVYGTYRHAPEYIRDLIRRDKRRADARQLERLQASILPKTDSGQA